MISRATLVKRALGLIAVLALFYGIVLLRHGARSRELIPLVERGNLTGVRELLSKGVDVNVRDEDGNTPLLTAAAFNRSSIADLLVQQGADVKARNNAGTTALHYASQNGAAELARLLLAKEAAIDARTGSGETALMFAIRSKHLTVAHLLCTKGADVNAANNLGQTVLMAASRAGFMDAVQFLLSRGAAINTRARDGMTALIAVAVGAGDRAGGPTAPASVGAHRQILMVLLNRGAEPNARTVGGLTALGAAVKAGRLDVAQQLLLKGADPRPLDAPARSTLLVNTVAASDTILLILLLRYPRDLDARDPEGRTALTTAARGDQAETMKLLLDAGAGINATCAPKNKSTQGGTALIVAAQAARTDALRMLLECGADVNAVDAAGQTALMAAVEQYRDHRLEWLRWRGGSIQSRIWGKSYTLSISPAEQKENDVIMAHQQELYTSIVRLLLSRGADLNLRDKSGNTALTLARRSQDATLIRMLQQAGAKR